MAALQMSKQSKLLMSSIPTHVKFSGLMKEFRLDSTLEWSTGFNWALEADEQITGEFTRPFYRIVLKRFDSVLYHEGSSMSNLKGRPDYCKKHAMNVCRAVALVPEQYLRSLLAQIIRTLFWAALVLR